MRWRARAAGGHDQPSDQGEAEPGARVAVLGVPRNPGSKARAATSSVIPGPSSSTETTTRPPSRRARTTTSDRAKRTALSTTGDAPGPARPRRHPPPSRRAVPTTWGPGRPCRVGHQAADVASRARPTAVAARCGRRPSWCPGSTPWPGWTRSPRAPRGPPLRSAAAREQVDLRQDARQGRAQLVRHLLGQPLLVAEHGGQPVQQAVQGPASSSSSRGRGSAPNRRSTSSALHSLAWALMGWTGRSARLTLARKTRCTRPPAGRPAVAAPEREPLGLRYGDSDMLETARDLPPRVVVGSAYSRSRAISIPLPVPRPGARQATASSRACCPAAAPASLPWLDDPGADVERRSSPCLADRTRRRATCHVCCGRLGAVPDDVVRLAAQPRGQHQVAPTASRTTHTATTARPARPAPAQALRPAEHRHRLHEIRYPMPWTVTSAPGASPAAQLATDPGDVLVEGVVVTRSRRPARPAPAARGGARPLTGPQQRRPSTRNSVGVSDVRRRPPSSACVPGRGAGRPASRGAAARRRARAHEPRDQLGEVERLGQVVVAAGREAAQQVAHLPAGGQEEHRRGRLPGPAAPGRRRGRRSRAGRCPGRRASSGCRLPVAGAARRRRRRRVTTSRPCSRSPRASDVAQLVVVLHHEHTGRRHVPASRRAPGPVLHLAGTSVFRTKSVRRTLLARMRHTLAPARADHGAARC